MILSIGDIVGHNYQILRLISDRGSFSDVYEAYDQFRSKNVILKVVHKDADSNKKRLLSEYQALSNIDRHPFVLSPVSHSFVTDDVPYFVFDLAGEATISDILKAGPLPQEEAIRVLCQLAVALAFIHKQGVYHLDVKPDNILWTAEGVMLFDFNAALTGGTSINRYDFAASPGYLPHDFDPDDNGHEALVDRDLYALGVTFYKCIAGVEPPEKCSYERLTLEDFPADDGFVYYVDTTARLLAPSRLDRFKTADDLLSSLLKVNRNNAIKKVCEIGEDFVSTIAPTCVTGNVDFTDITYSIEDKFTHLKYGAYGEALQDIADECCETVSRLFGAAKENWFDYQTLLTELESILDGSLAKAKEAAFPLFQAQSDPTVLHQFQWEIIRMFIIENLPSIVAERTEEAITLDLLDNREKPAEGFIPRHFDAIHNFTRAKLYRDLPQEKQIDMDIFKAFKSDIDTMIEEQVREQVMSFMIKKYNAAMITLFISDD